MRGIDFKEYTRLRDIVQKRQKRASAAGLAAPVYFPTVKEIRSGWVDAQAALQAVKSYYSGGSTLRAIRQTGLVPEVRKFEVQPQKPKLSDAEKRQKKREQDRLYRQRQKVRKAADSDKKAKEYVGYLKALQTLQARGFKTGLDLAKMTPALAQAFAEYMEYRFSQGDFNQTYVIDEFVRDFSRIMKEGYTGEQIKGDFEKFLEDRSRLENRRLNMEGLTEGEFMYYWNEFPGR